MSEEAQIPPAPPSDAPPPPASPPPASSAGGGSENRTLWLVLAYLWLLALVPLLAEQEDKEVQWHAKHGLVLTGVEVAIWLLFWILSFTGVFACLGCIVAIPVFIASVVVRILCIDKAMKGGRFMIPGLSELADRF